MGAHMKYPLGPRVQVHVTKEALTKAVTADSSRCWIAESIKAAVPNATRVAVEISTTRFTDPERGLRYVYLTPYKAQEALLEFDEGTPPAPFTFILKNAHVTRAGGPHTKEGRDKEAAARKARLLRSRESVPTKATLANGHSRELPRRVGGRRPPQLRVMRRFGVRAFRGASMQRLLADQAIIAQAEKPRA